MPQPKSTIDDALAEIGLEAGEGQSPTQKSPTRSVAVPQSNHSGVDREQLRQASQTTEQLAGIRQLLVLIATVVCIGVAVYLVQAVVYEWRYRAAKQNLERAIQSMPGALP